MFSKIDLKKSKARVMNVVLDLLVFVNFYFVEIDRFHNLMKTVDFTFKKTKNDSLKIIISLSKQSLFKILNTIVFLSGEGWGNVVCKFPCIMNY